MKLLLTSDWHLTSKQPKCRKDDYIEAQRHMLKQINHLSSKHEAKIIFAGDMVDRCDDFKAIALFWRDIPSIYQGVCGNHDLPNNDLDNFEISPIGLYKSLSDDTSNINISFSSNNCLYRVTHHFVAEKELPHWCTDGFTAKALIDMSDTPLIVTGDNHQSFVVKHEGITLVNPGATMRSKADQKDFKPRVYIYDTDTQNITEELLDISRDEFDASYIEREKEINERFTKIVTESPVDVDIDFDANLNKALKDARDSVKKYFRVAREAIIKGI